MLHLHRLSALLTMAPLLHPRVPNDPVQKYLFKMCYPLLSNFYDNFREISRNFTYMSDIDNAIASTIALSPFPCEQAFRIRDICTANGTTAIDFLAEQQCLCGGTFWDVSVACSNCYHIHGFYDSGGSHAAPLTTYWASLSTAECAPTPPYQPYVNLISTGDIFSYFSSIETRASVTLASKDLFPNDTAVSNYFTPTRSITAGEITGSATGRLTSWTNTGGVRYTPVSTPITSTTAQGSEVRSTSTTAALSSSTNTSANKVAATSVNVMGGLLVLGLGVAAML